ncbi:hypothetical protein [Actinoplanes sp. NPDC049802]|uniref:2OG-Fe(II)-dependent halogenase WelO5 family protein n=1 Tax=Actinoplanes sp. NPDC049802 TaxID=3154742 RepID=UPI0033C46A16
MSRLDPISTDRFRIVESDKLDISLIDGVLKGELTCVVVRQFATTQECQELLFAFRSSTSRRQRAGDATGEYVGSFHWGKDLDDYFDDCDAIRAGLELTLGRASTSPWHRFEQQLVGEMAVRDVEVGRAVHNGRRACAPIIRSWNGVGRFALIPHEDIAQCSDPRQAGFEIQSVEPSAVGSINLCLANGDGGRLLLWQHFPTEKERERFGTTYTGGPYPAEYVQEFPSLELDVKPGDLYVFNGSMIHAVTGVSGERVTISSLIGYVSPSKVAMWT